MQYSPEVVGIKSRGIDPVRLTIADETPAEPRRTTKALPCKSQVHRHFVSDDFAGNYISAPRS